MPKRLARKGLVFFMRMANALLDEDPDSSGLEIAEFLATDVGEQLL